VNLPESPLEPTPPSDPQTPESQTSQDVFPVISPDPDASMQEYFQLQDTLLKVTLIITGVVFISVWIFYSLNIAINYLIGACTGVVYLRMLARNVAQLGREKKKLGNSRLALLIGLIIVASQLNELQIMPIFLGFLTYKVTIIFYTLKTTLLPDSR
jgi:ATP synthase protein I